MLPVYFVKQAGYEDRGRDEWKEGGQKVEMGHQYVCISGCFCVQCVGA